MNYFIQLFQLFIISVYFIQLLLVLFFCMYECCSWPGHMLQCIQYTTLFLHFPGLAFHLTSSVWCVVSPFSPDGIPLTHPDVSLVCTFDVTVHRRPCIFHAVIKICRSGLPWHLSVLIWGSGAVTLVNATLRLKGWKVTFSPIL